MDDDPYTPSPIDARVVIGSLLFLLGQIVITLTVASLVALSWPLPYRVRWALGMVWIRLTQRWLVITCQLRYEVEGVENIPDTPCVVLSKHQSAWETIHLHNYFAPQVWVVKRELLWLPIFGWGLAALKPIAIDRRAGKFAMQKVVEQGRARLADRLWVVVFPEGTRVAPGERRRYKLGGAALAERTGARVVPVAHNSGAFWPRKSFLKRRGVIRLVIGPPIESKGRSASEINRLAETWIEDTMERLRAPYARRASPQSGASEAPVAAAPGPDRDPS